MSIRTQLYANNAKTTLASAISSSVQTTITVSDGSTFPTPGANQFFLATIESGGSVEIVDIVARTGNTLTVRTSPSLGRGMEGTTATSWGAGAAFECRTTAGTLGQFARYQDRLQVVTTIDTLTIPNGSDANSYICQSVDDGGNPITALYTSATYWRFLSHPKVLVSGAITSAPTVTSFTSTAISTLLTGFTGGKYILQFTSGVNQGTARMITATGTNSVTWLTAYSVAPSVADTFEIYQSAYSILNSAASVADSAILYSIIFGS